jgi:hypothetical protein
MLSRTEARALFGLPPKAMRPSPPAANNPEIATRRSTFDLPARPPLSVSSLSRKDGAYVYGTVNDHHCSLYDASDSTDTEEMDTPNYLAPPSVPSSANNTLRAESSVDVASTHRRSMAPTPSTTLGGQLSARLPIENEIIRLKVQNILIIELGMLG